MGQTCCETGKVVEVTKLRMELTIGSSCALKLKVLKNVDPLTEFKIGN